MPVPMPRLGRITAEGLMDRQRPLLRRSSAATIADRDRAILGLWDIDWPVEAIAAELGLAVRLVEQAVATFEGNDA